MAGVKRWHFFPPEVAHLLRRNPSYRRSEIIFDVREVDEELFPGWKEARKHEICVEQRVRQVPSLLPLWSGLPTDCHQAGETMFVPSGWYHQVINLTDCISVKRVFVPSNCSDEAHISQWVSLGQSELVQLLQPPFPI